MRACLQGAGSRKVHITAIEKNPTGIRIMRERFSEKQEVSVWEGNVTDAQIWREVAATTREAPRVVMLEMMGSIGCNEAQPETCAEITRQIGCQWGREAAKQLVYMPRELVTIICEPGTGNVAYSRLREHLEPGEDKVIQNIEYPRKAIQHTAWTHTTGEEVRATTEYDLKGGDGRWRGKRETQIAGTFIAKFPAGPDMLGPHGGREPSPYTQGTTTRNEWDVWVLQAKGTGDTHTVLRRTSAGGRPRYEITTRDMGMSERAKRAERRQEEGGGTTQTRSPQPQPPPPARQQREAQPRRPVPDTREVTNKWIGTGLARKTPRKRDHGRKPGGGMVNRQNAGRGAHEDDW